METVITPIAPSEVGMEIQILDSELGLLPSFEIETLNQAQAAYVAFIEHNEFGASQAAIVNHADIPDVK